LLAALFAALAASVAPLLLAEQAASENAAVYLWLAMVGTLGSWAILVPAKFAEGKIEDQVPMRIVLLLLGAVVGVAAWFLGDVLLLRVASWDEPVGLDVGLLSQEALHWSRLPNAVNPSLPHYVAYFAFLFLVLRWWRQAECTRSSRLSLWTVFVCVLWAWVLQLFWWFPQPTGMLAAGVIAFATQMSSPWLPPSGRRALQLEADQAA
jgi:eukaryotic-like serine/threonine-protein kinase